MIADTIDTSIVISGSVKVMIDRVRVENSQTNAINFEGGSISATVRDSVFAGNNIGILAQGTGTNNVMVDRSAFVNNNFGSSPTAVPARRSGSVTRR